MRSSRSTVAPSIGKSLALCSLDGQGIFEGQTTGLGGHHWSRYHHTCDGPVSHNPVLPFLDFSVLPRKNLKLTKDFRPLLNPLKPWKKQRKCTINQGNSLLKINQGIPKNQGTEGQGRAETPELGGVTRANRFARFESEIRVIRANRPDTL